MNDVINQYTMRMVLHLIDTTSAHCWRVSAGSDSEGQPLFFWATPDDPDSTVYALGQYIHCTVSCTQFLTEGRWLSSRYTLTDIVPYTLGAVIS